MSNVLHKLNADRMFDKLSSFLTFCWRQVSKQLVAKFRSEIEHELLRLLLHTNLSKSSSRDTQLSISLDIIKECLCLEINANVDNIR